MTRRTSTSQDMQQEIDSVNFITLYILKCFDGSYYTGVTKNIKKRLFQHNMGFCRYTKDKRPLNLVYMEYHERYPLKREQYIQKLNRVRKEKLIERGLL